MKWFKHFSDSYSNLKLQSVKAKFGIGGYGVYWTILELVAQQGDDNFSIDPKKGWREALVGMTSMKEEFLEEMLIFFGDINLIDRKSLDKGILFIPKLQEYSDEYTAKLRSKSRQDRDFVVLEEEGEEDKKKNRTDKNIYGTPKEQAMKFFTNENNEQLKVLEGLIKKGIPKDFAEFELKKFINYWSELTLSGKKQKWQTKPTFEISRRLATWFNNARQYNQTRETKGIRL